MTSNISTPHGCSLRRTHTGLEGARTKEGPVRVEDEWNARKHRADLICLESNGLVVVLL